VKRSVTAANCIKILKRDKKWKKERKKERKKAANTEADFKSLINPKDHGIPLLFAVFPCFLTHK